MPESLVIIAGGIADRIPEGVVTWGGEVIDQVKDSPVLLTAVAVVGILTAMLVVFGILKRSFKAAVIGGLLSVAASYVIIR
jgi:hypothetical protein